MYTRKTITKLTGNENFINTENKFSVLDFWRYGFSNLNSNVLRGALTEFIVESALKDQKDIDIRNPWGDYDVEYKGKKIEVKSCSYLQDWNQEKLTNIQWSGLKAKSLYWSSAVSKFQSSEEKDYKSDIYVLGLLNHKETDTLDILNLNQWVFYVLSKDELKRISNNKGAVSLVKLEKNNIRPVMFSELKKFISST